MKLQLILIEFKFVIPAQAGEVPFRVNPALLKLVPGLRTLKGICNREDD